MSKTTHSLAVIGIGHSLRSDDSLGAHAIEALKARLPNIFYALIPTDISRLFDIFEHFSHVFIVDALVTTHPTPGKRHRITQDSLHAVKTACASSHAFNLAESIAIAKNLGILPTHWAIYGIEACDFSWGAQLSEPVHHALPALIDDLYTDILSYLEEPSCTN